jgi:hypothetical protein
VERELEAVGEVLVEVLGKGFSVTVFAPGTDLVAADGRIRTRTAAPRTMLKGEKSA